MVGSLLQRVFEKFSIIFTETKYGQASNFPFLSYPCASIPAMTFVVLISEFRLKTASSGDIETYNWMEKYNESITFKTKLVASSSSGIVVNKKILA